MGAKKYSGIWSQNFDMSSASGYTGAKHVQEFGLGFVLTCPQLVGTWVQNVFRELVPDFWHDSQMDLDLNISSL